MPDENKYGGLTADKYIERLEAAIGQMKTKFSEMRVASQNRDKRMDELINQRREQSAKIKSLQTELNLARQLTSPTSPDCAAADVKLADMVRAKSAEVEQQRLEIHRLRDDIALLKRTADVAERNARELELMRRKVQLSEATAAAGTSGGAQGAHAAQLSALESEIDSHKAVTESLSEVQAAKIKSLEQQLEDTRRQFQQSQLHASELIKAKESVYQVKLKQGNEAIERRKKQDDIIAKLRDALGKVSAENDGLRARLAERGSATTRAIVHGAAAGVLRGSVDGVSKEELAQQLEETAAVARQSRHEVAMLTSLTSHDKEVIASQTRELEVAKERESVMEHLQEMVARLQSDVAERDRTVASLREAIHNKESDFLALRATMKFGDLASRAKSTRVRKEAEKQVAAYVDKVAEKEAEVRAKEALVSKKEQVIDTQRAFSNEVLGKPLSREEIERALEEVNDGLVQVIRDASGVPWTVARNTVQCVLEVLFERLPNGKIVNAINQAVRPGPFWGDNDGGKDAAKLQEAALTLAGYEDESRTGIALSLDAANAVVGAVDSITQIVTDGSEAVVTAFLRSFEHPNLHCEVVEGRDGTEFAVVLMLTALYRETARTDVRRALCRSFHTMGHLLPDVHDVLQDTTLPLEIARDVKERGILGRDAEEDIAELREALELAVVLLGHGDALPAIDLEYMDVVFVTDLLLLAESDALDARGERIKLLALEVVLAYNLQFAEQDQFFAKARRSKSILAPFGQNVVLTALSQFMQSNRHKNITERLLKLVNRLHDPLALPEMELQHRGKTRKQNSVLKLLVDIFSDDNLGLNFFGVSDLQVLVDIALREIRDKEPDDFERLQFVQLLFSITVRSAYEQIEPELQNKEVRPTFERLASEPNEGDDRVIDRIQAIADEALKVL